MCDYSLMMNNNRLATDGEELITHRFRTGSVGLVSVWDFDDWQAQRRHGLWQRFKDCFLFHQGEPQPVVCVPPGARLRLHEFGPCDTAIFTQISADEDRHRDALLFEDGRTLSLQLLPEGQTMTLLRLSSAEDVEDPHMAEPVLNSRRYRV
jgi:hypothetical protein